MAASIPTDPTRKPVFIAGDYRAHLAELYQQATIVGLPSPQDVGPLLLEQLYVPLSFSPERARAPKERFYLPKALADSRHLVVLGDPGSGKSTLVKVIVDQFGRSQPTELAQRFGKLTPIPIILRDYNVRTWRSYRDMFESYVIDLKRRAPELSYLESAWLIEQLQAGEAIVLLDGLDEVGSRADREHLRDKIIFPLVRTFSDAYVMLTSRIVGYEEVSFERPEVVLFNESYRKPNEVRSIQPVASYRNTSPKSLHESSLPFLPEGRVITPPLERFYLVPFNDEDIAQFIQRWYVVRENDLVKREEAVKSLASAIRQSDSVRQLAGTPALLTLMALVHRVFTYLPNGRIELYDKVAEAYLHTLDQAKFGRQYPATLQEMKRRLARVGYELQNRRQHTYEKSETERNMLATEAEVLHWLTEAIAEKNDGDQAAAREEAENFLAHVAHRSGLLIPRGPHEYAFAHLTFQEYFAAQHMARNRKTLAQECGKRITLRYWHETLCLLFEILGKAEDEVSDELFDDLRAASEKASAQASQFRTATAELFAALTIDSQNGLSPRKRREAAGFALTELSDNYNDEIVKTLRELPQVGVGSFETLINRWLDAQLTDTTAKLGDNFFITGLSLTDEITNDWQTRLVAWVESLGYRAINEHQMFDLALIGASNKTTRAELCPWLSLQFPLPLWFVDIGWYWGGAISFAELYREPLESLPDNSLALRLLHECNIGQALSNSLLIRAAMLLFANGDEASTRAIALDFARSFSEESEITFALARASQSKRADTLALAFTLTRECDLAGSCTRSLVGPRVRHLIDPPGRNLVALAHSLVASLLAPPPVSESTGQRLTIPNASEWLIFAPKHSRYTLTIATLIAQATTATDEWTCLQALNALLALGKGTPEICAVRHALVAKGYAQPDAFSFPADMTEMTETAEFRAQLPDLMQLCFIYSPENKEGQDWINPADFAPDSPHARFFTSEPREFFIAAAAVLDPENETDLLEAAMGNLA